MWQDINKLLGMCKAIPASQSTLGGNFYELRSQKFHYPNGTIQSRDYIVKDQASVVVPITEEGHIICIIQPIGLAKEGSLLEIPAGYATDDEISTQTAMRELVEETGYVPKELKYLGEHYQDPGSIKATVSVFVALDCQRKMEQKLDKGEYIKVLELPKEQLKMLMDSNQIKDANTYIALAKCRFANYF